MKLLFRYEIEPLFYMKLTIKYERKVVENNNTY